MPRISPERSRNASDGTRMPRKIASPPSRGIGRRLRRRASGLSTTPSSRAMPPTAGRQEHDDQKRDRRAVQDLRVVPKLAHRRLLRAVEPVACVPETRDDVALLVQAAVDRCDDDARRRDGRGGSARFPRASRSARSAGPSVAPRPSPSRPPRRSSCRSRASDRAGSRRGRRCRSGASRSTRPAGASPRRDRGR